MRQWPNIVLIFSTACASAPPPRATTPPPATAQQNEKRSEDYIGPTWFDSEGKEVVRESSTATTAVAQQAPPPRVSPAPGPIPREGQTVVYQRPDHTYAWIATGVGAALVVAGGVFIGTSVSAANRRDDLIEEQPDRFDARPVRRADNEAYAYSIAAASSFSAAAVAFGAAIYLFLTNTGEAPPDYEFGAVTLHPNGLRVDF